jgi:hypothetical protein
MSKQAVTNPFLKYDSDSEFDSKWLPSLFQSYDFVTLFSEVSPLIFLLLIAFLSYKSITSTVDLRCIKWIVTTGTMLSYMLVATFWLSGRNFAPRMVYGFGFGLLVLNFLLRYLGIFKREDAVQRITNLALVMVTAWSPTILILLGKQGSFVALVCLFAGTVSLYYDITSGTTACYVIDLD